MLSDCVPSASRYLTHISLFFPKAAFGTPPDCKSLAEETFTLLDSEIQFVPSYFLSPHTVDAESNQYVPSAGEELGAVALLPNSARSTSALRTYALLAIPKKLYAAINPYSFVSSPWTGEPPDVLKLGLP